MTVKNDIYSMATGTCYQGTITATFEQLSDLLVFTDLGAGDKSTHNLVGMVGGQVVTVYDYYNDKPIAPDAEYTWNVGGKNKFSVLFLEDALYKRYGKSFEHTTTARVGSK